MRSNHEPVERKVTWATAAAYLGSTGLLGVLAAVQDNARLLDPLPDALSPFVLAVVPTVVAFAAGWKADHSPRDETPGGGG
ncbi:holin [Streptomyces sp. NE06-03C]|uniref:holin n=1 Tax=Streptomyces sp. NE06-03C TaxID=3028694 RepID=UPI0029AD486D|nr:holin [Streptomyces sp. NE06-03C]MDX2917283.1 holin [Streptomyces sp. NE06-03C]